MPIKINFGSCVRATHTYYKRANPGLTCGWDVRRGLKTLNLCNPNTRHLIHVSTQDLFSHNMCMAHT